MKLTKKQLKEIIREEIQNLNESKHMGLMVFPSSLSDKQKIQRFLGSSIYSGEWDKGGYFFFPEEKWAYDALERELEKKFSSLGINARFEGI